jgi:hypothetical protein
MDTNTTESSATPGSLFDPLSGWEAATRWNAATFDMMARAWQQWLALLTVVPPHFVPARSASQATAAQPAQAASQRMPRLRENESLEPVLSARDAHAFARDEARTSRSTARREAKPSARRESKRSSSSKPARGKAKAARARG